jgi:arginyl-tRNA synthetase
MAAFGADGDRGEIARKIAVATIKFGDLINHRSKDYVFDLDKFLATEGKTGTFLLYTVARINSILKKAEEEPALPGIYSDLERELFLKMALSGEAFGTAFAERAPNAVADNAYQLAATFSRFYHEHHILSGEDPVIRRSRLGLCVAVKTLLLKHLDVLGIEAVDRM